MGLRTSPDVGTTFVIDFASGSLIPSVFIGVYRWFNCIYGRRVGVTVPFFSGPVEAFQSTPRVV